MHKSTSLCNGENIGLDFDSGGAETKDEQNIEFERDTNGTETYSEVKKDFDCSVLGSTRLGSDKLRNQSGDFAYPRQH